MTDKKDGTKLEFYTEENPGGPWSRALKAMSDRENRLKKSASEPKEEEQSSA